MSCASCKAVKKSAKGSSSSSTTSKFPSVLELAHLVNLEYYVQFSAGCIHQIDKNLTKKDEVSITEMLKYLDTHKWELRAHEEHGGKYLIN